MMKALLAITAVAAVSAQPPRAAPLVLNDHAGFVSIFDGVSLRGWDGDPAFWRVENGSIVGQSTPDNPVKQNTFAIWRGGEPRDFELKVEYRISSTNSGVQFRSVQLPAGSDVGKWVMKGYQADIDFANQYTGQIYEERGRGFLAMRGQTVYVPDGGRPTIIGTLGEDDVLKRNVDQPTLEDHFDKAALPKVMQVMPLHAFVSCASRC